jgi:hypothetical protein
LGWGNYAPRQKSNEQLALERRRELGNKFFSDIDELVQLAAECKKKPKVLPPGPPLVDDAPEPEPEVVGPCQEWTRHWKAVRAAKAAGQVTVEVVDDEPYVSEREKKLRASRAYYREYGKRQKQKNAKP